jgi:hypothetical protein
VPPNPWGLVKHTVPTDRDFPPAAVCTTLPSWEEHSKRQEARFFAILRGEARAPTPEETQWDREERATIVRCQVAALAVLGHWPRTERITISDPQAWDAHQQRRRTRALWTWRGYWVGVPLAAIFLGAGIAMVCFQGLLNAFREQR